EAQKNKFARYQTTAKLLNNIDSSPIPVENIDYDIDLFKKGMLANLSRMPKGGDAATVRSIAEFTTRNSERNDEFYNSVSDSVTAMVNALPNDPQIVLNFLSNPGCLALVRSEGVAEKMLSLVVKLMTDSSYDWSLVQAFTKLGSKSHSALKMMLDEKAMYRFIDKVIEDYKKNLIEKGVPASENDMKKRWAFVESFATEEQKIKFATYRHAERLLSRVDANSDILLLPILEADSDYDKEILQKAMLTRLQSAQKNDLTNHYALARLVPEIKIIAEFTQVSKDQEFSNSVSEHITGIIENLMILANKNVTSSRAINAGDSDQYRKLLIALLGNDFVISLANKELIRAALFELKNKNSEVVKACVPVLFGRIDEMLSDLGFAEYKAEVESRAMKQVSNVTMGHMHIRGAMISMPASTHTSLSPQLREMCGLISQFGSESDKKELANKLDLLRVHATTDYPGNAQAKKTYYVLMQKAAVEHLASLAKKLNSSSPGGFFDDKERVEDQRKLAKLKVAYEVFATGFFKGISKIFTKKQTYEGAIKVMQEKVLDRVQAGKAPDGASYDTLDEVKRLPDGVPGKGFKKEFRKMK
ncbi:MAG: hypothetical protein NTU49_02705, partial [Gammaproteobacteria bacterium]|nr:hypothetical protein [Gammaproteobacteria bacterium]